jgi:hypothetical protein
MANNGQHVIEKIGGSALTTALGEQAGLSPEKANEIAKEIIDEAKGSGSGLETAANIVAIHHDVASEKAAVLAAGVGAKLAEAVDLAEGAAREWLLELKAEFEASALGKAIKELDKDGDGDPFNDLAVAAKTAVSSVFRKP